MRASTAAKKEKCLSCANYFRPDGQCLFPILGLDEKRTRLIFLIPGTDCQLYLSREGRYKR